MANRFTISTIFRALDQFSGPVTRMSKNAQRFARTADASLASVGSTMRGLRNLVIGIGTALATGYITKAITEFASKGHEIAETARILGMSSTAYQEIAYAAKMLGVEEEKLVGPMQKMNNNLGQLKARQGSLYSHLVRTNPRLAAQLRTVTDSSEAFMLLIDAVGRETDASKRAALAQAAFGRAGQEIILMAAAGSGEIAKLRAEAYKYGAILDPGAVAGSEHFVDSLKRLKDSLRGVANIIMGKMVLALQPLIQRLAEWVAANRQIIAQKITAVFQGIGRAISIVARLWKSGLIPAILAGIVAFKAITLGVQLWTAAQALLNAAMSANPIGLIIVGVAALIALIVLAIMNWNKITAAVGRAWGALSNFASLVWDRVVGAFRAIWEAISNLLNNPLIAAAGLIFAPFITVPLLIAKHWEQVKAVIASVVEWVLAAVQKISSAGRWVAGIFGGAGAAAGPVSPNAGMIESRAVEESRATVDVNLHNLPTGSTVKQTGRAPGFTLNAGFAFGGR